MIALRLFGGASLESDGTAVAGHAAQRHRIALLALLAASHPRALTREKLMACLWPERDAEHARKLLNQSVHVLRKAFGDATILSSGNDLRLSHDTLHCDVVAFEQALAAGDRERALDLYAGPFLDGFFLSDVPEFERWVDEERERFRQERRQALTEVAGERESLGDHVSAAEHWRRVLVDDPYDARSTLRLMQALEKSGDRAAALRQARQHAVLMEQDFDAAPNPEIVALAERLRAAPSLTAQVAARPEPARENVESVQPLAPNTGDRSSPSPRRATRRWRWIAVCTAVPIMLAYAYVSGRPADHRHPSAESPCFRWRT